MDQLKNNFEKSNNREGTGSLLPYYLFWDMKEGAQAVIRFLPDKDESNPNGYFVARHRHNLEVEGETKRIPCLQMYNEDCPICKLSQHYYNVEKNKELGKKYWRDINHVSQIIVVEDPLPLPDDGQSRVGKIHAISMGFQLLNSVKEGLASGDLDVVPFAYEGGTDFAIKKTLAGGRNNYSVGSRFLRRSRDLTEEEIAYVEDNIVNLRDLLPKKIEVDEVQRLLDLERTGGVSAGFPGSAFNAPPSEPNPWENAAHQPTEAPIPTPSQPASAPTPAPAAEASATDDFSAYGKSILDRVRSRVDNKEG
jgi:hypothetical protein